MKLRYFLALFVLTLSLLLSSCTASKSQLMNAASEGDIGTLRQLQAEGKDINEKDSKGTTALMYAIKSKKSEAAKYLIDAGADINNKDSYFTPLIYAVYYQQNELINILLKKGANTEARDYSGETALIHAALRIGDIDSVKMLISAGADVNVKSNYYIPPRSLLELLVDAGRPALNNIIAELINAGADISVPTNGKARLVFFAEGLQRSSALARAAESASISVGEDIRYIYPESVFNFFDVNPGNNKITISILTSTLPSMLRKKTELSIDTKPNNTYYFVIFKRGTSSTEVASHVLLGEIVPLVMEGITGKTPFGISQIQEQAAKEKIKSLLKSP